MAAGPLKIHKIRDRNTCKPVTGVVFTVFGLFRPQRMHSRRSNCTCTFVVGSSTNFLFTLFRLDVFEEEISVIVVADVTKPISRHQMLTMVWKFTGKYS